VGSLSTRKVDVRVIAATNHNLRAAVAEKRFREDLYYRLSMVEIQVPRLAERKEDLPLLERHFIARFAAQYKKEIRGLTHRAQARLSLHHWPGNVRELENVLGHSCMMAMGDTIDMQDLPAYLRSAAGPEESREAIAPTTEVGTLAEQERLLIVRALETAHGNQSEAARILRIGRDALRYKLKKHNLETQVVTQRAADGK
jgi:DNA-binding NtrC family response regulator